MGAGQDADVLLAEAKFRALDTDGSNVLSGDALPQLADWVWSHFYPGGAELTHDERSKLVAKLLPRQQKNAGQASLTLKDFIKWFLSVRDRVPKEEQTKSAPQTPSAVNDENTSSNRALDISATFPTQSTPVPTPTTNLLRPTVLPTGDRIPVEEPEDEVSLRQALRVLTDSLVDMQSRVQPTTVNSTDPTLTTLANSLEQERVRNGKLIRIQKRLQDDLAKAEAQNEISFSRGAEIEDRAREVVQARREATDARREITDLKDENATLQIKLQETREELRSSREELVNTRDLLVKKGSENTGSLRKHEEEVAFHKERAKSLEASLASLRKQHAATESSSAAEDALRKENRELQAKVAKLEEESMAALRAAELSTQMVDKLQTEVNKFEARESESTGNQAQMLKREVMRLESSVSEWKQRAADLEDEVVAERSLRRLQADLHSKWELAEERAERAEQRLIDVEERATKAEVLAQDREIELARVKAVADGAESKKRALTAQVATLEARVQEMGNEAQQESAAKDLLASQLRHARTQVEEAQRQLLMSDADTLAKEDAAAGAQAKISVAKEQLADARRREEDLQRQLREAYDDLERERSSREDEALAAQKKEQALQAKLKEVVSASYQAKQEAQKQLDYGSRITAELQSKRTAPHSPALETADAPLRAPAPGPIARQRAAPPPPPAATRASPPAPPPAASPVVLHQLPPTKMSTSYRPAGISTPGYSKPNPATSPGLAGLQLNTTLTPDVKPVRQRVTEASDVDARDVSPMRHRWVNTTTVV
mmetsp:Transcript_61837/g.145794  ORF Transcript_61837/g.145794 Transcript_61837/m.145794 type:complete len:779 (-) Transcript_61837:264-2600(-)